MIKNRIIVCVDLQNDFIDGVLGSDAARNIIPNVINFFNTLTNNDYLIFTRDTHTNNEKSIEFKTLPRHCLLHTTGHEINEKIIQALGNHDAKFINKESFESLKLPDTIKNIIKTSNLDSSNTEIVLFGLCTDICVISNALNLRGNFPDFKISVIKDCCAGSTKENHIAALTVLKSNLIDIL